MYDYTSKKVINEIPYRQMQFKYDQFYKKIKKKEENNKFLEKYCRLNEQIKCEEQY